MVVVFLCMVVKGDFADFSNQIERIGAGYAHFCIPLICE